jgi:hypothetical protein
LLGVGDFLPVAKDTLWGEFVKRWSDAGKAFQQTCAASEKSIDLINTRFQDFYRLNYTKWLNRSDIPVVFTHQFLSRLLKPYWDHQKGPKAIILVFDGLRTDAWDEFLRPCWRSVTS